MSGDEHQWGIIGAGGISRRFAGCLGNVDDASLYAVGSRRPGEVAAYAEAVGARRGYGSYEELINDDAVAVVYVGNDHVDHVSSAMLAVAHRRHVLVEKPLGVSASEADELFIAARNAGVFVMEAMWTRFLPAVEELRDLLVSGVIGVVREAEISFGAEVDPVANPRIFDPWRAGGALMDRGVYPLAIAHMLLGRSDEIESAESRIVDGVDRETTVVSRHGSCLAHLSSSCDRALPNTVELRGDKGTIVIPAPLIRPQSFDVTVGAASRHVERPFEGHGFEFEIRATHEAIDQGWVEHPKWTHGDTLATHAALDEVRRRTGLVYPFERPASPDSAGS